MRSRSPGEAVQEMGARVSKESRRPMSGDWAQGGRFEVSMFSGRFGGPWQFYSLGVRSSSSSPRRE
eukprot:6597923-Pyramimonas_sp.AAC.1